MACHVTFEERRLLYLLKQRMQNLPPCRRRSITLDNGKEFEEHRTLTRRLGVEINFAEPYASWQRRGNENTNGLLRQYFPKALISRRSATAWWHAWNNQSAIVPGDDSTIERPTK